jgi:23S rRNA (uracil1939-C5)-methyltransferase
MKRAHRQKRAVPPAKSALVHIEKPIYGGSFLARLDGKATFVPLTVPGEEARVRITEEKRSYATAEPEEILKSSSSRVVPLCSHFGTCGGCNYQHADYATQLEWKETILRETLERGGIPVPAEIRVLTADPWHYRNRIRLAFDQSGNVGYRGRRSHEIVPIRECPISAPLLVHAALAAAEILSTAKPSFRPTELSLFCNAGETQLLASIFVQTLATQGFEQFAAAWKERIPALAAIEMVHEAHPAQQPQQIARWGEPSITYRAAAIDYRVDHGAFFQVNRWLLDEFVQTVVADRRGALAWDLFAGVGLFSRQLADRFAEVIAIESAPQATQALASILDGTSGRNVNSDTFSFLKSHRRASCPDLIVVDPPRAGLGPETTALLAEIAPPRIVYVSCDPATLARDLRALLTSGYSLVSVTLADLFPQTFHIETVVELQRS